MAKLGSVQPSERATESEANITLVGLHLEREQAVTREVLWQSRGCESLNDCSVAYPGFHLGYKFN